MFTRKSTPFMFLALIALVFILGGIVPNALANPAPASTIIIPVGYNFPVALNTGQGVVGGKPGIAFDGSNFLVPYLQGADIYARRVSPQGAVLDATPIVISVGLNEIVFPPSVVFDGTNYFLAWVAMRNGANGELYGARVTPAGVVLDPGGTQITTEGNVKIRMPGLAFDGVNYLATWRTNNDLIYGTRISTSVVNLDAPAGFPIATTGASWYPAVAFDGTNYLAVWHDGRSNSTNGYDIYGARITTEGSVLDPNGFVICSEVQNQEHSMVGFDGTNFLVAWYDWRPNNDNIFGSLYGARVASDGTVLDIPSFQIADRARGQVAPNVVCGGTDCQIIWFTDYPNIGNKFRLSDVWGRRIRPDGSLLDPQAIPIATAYGHQFGPIAGYGGGRYLVVWNESTGREVVGAVYGQILEEQTSSSSQRVFPSQPTVPIKQDAEIWTIENAPITDHAIAGLAFSPTDSWAFGGTDAFHYQNGVWQSETMYPTAHIYGTWGRGPSDIWVTGWCGAFSHYDGETWTDLGCTGGYTKMGLWGLESNNLWGVTNNGTLFHYDGSTHGVSPMNTGLPLDFSDIWGTSNDNIYAVGERGLVFHYDGTTWTRQASIPTIQRLNAIWGGGPNDIFAVGDWGTIIHFDGTSWSLMAGNTLQQLYDIWGWSGRDVYAVGFGGTILHFDGTTWTPENGGTDMDLLSVWGAPGENTIAVWASGSGQQILKKVKPALAITSITRASKNPTSASTVNFTVTLPEPVTGLDVSDFSLTVSGLTNVVVSQVNGSGNTYTITVKTGAGNGTLRLDVPPTASLNDLADNPLSVLSYTSGEIYTVHKMQTFRSVGAYDGWILESTETSIMGGILNQTATSFNIGDETFDRQYRSILSFNTATLPDNAVITKVTLKIRKQGLVGTNPFTILGGLKVDMRKPFFGPAVGLTASDFQAAAGRVGVATFEVAPVNNWYSALLNAAGRAYVNKTGTTQFRLYFAKDDNDDNGADYVKFFSGNYATASARPTLLVEYYVP